ncbi:hypothetical protein [Polyangium aurulentum]|uniref:hypothetical protein n=1 Tax=Polyangium aurulentum TaxID=2567896 RepID=UPI0010AE8391|nr:hypothetical protein [Polyangium aurulentum]UQA58124.1 hypothetical protein E8A73_043845 [Polyangium aurulentum]
MPSPYDCRLALRALALGALVALVAVIVVATTDEGAGWARRAALCAALAPVAGGVGALGAARIARSRGEARALEALGAHPLRALAGAVVGGALLGALGGSIVLSGAADLEPLFPRPTEARVWTADPEGGMRERSLGIRLAPGGALSFAAERDDALRDRRRGEDRRAPVGAALWVLAVAGPLWSVQEGSPLGRGLLGVLLVVAAIASFQLAAAGRASAWVVCVSPLVLLACALASRYRARPSP